MTIDTTTTLRPGLLVSLSVTVGGDNVKYNTKDIEKEHTTDAGARKAKWETERVIRDPIEHEAGIKARSKARSLITAACIGSSFGLLCPAEKEDELTRAIANARAVAKDFNDNAKLSKVYVNVLFGRIAADEVEAVRAINSEVRELMETMQAGLKGMDVKVIRDAAQRAKNMGAMLTPDAEAKVTIAVEAARKAARRIVEAGEAGAIEVDAATIRKIGEMRTSFLDMDDAGAVQAPAETARAVDFAPAAPIAAPAPAPTELDLALREQDALREKLGQME